MRFSNASSVSSASYMAPSWKFLSAEYSTLSPFRIAREWSVPLDVSSYSRMMDWQGEARAVRQ